MSNSKPGPVVTSAGVASFISAVVLVLGFLGLKDQASALNGEATAITAVVAGLIPIITTLVAAFHARDKVTPVASPRNNDGVRMQAVTSPIPPAVTMATPTVAVQPVDDDDDLPDGPLPQVTDDDHTPGHAADQPAA